MEVVGGGNCAGGGQTTIIVDEILFSTRFSTTLSAPYPVPDSKIKKISISVPFWATIDRKTNFTQNTLHASFISKKELRFPSQMLLETSIFYPIFTSFHSA